ncbi:MAG: hypothetical protein CMH62_00330 [Nanoarchaeota archaeon]|nr:hypothetical protein [Nanoarchaeota archaeon]|tara:strand:+ start:58 stop:624 length:567 start_codon:yes stop_codon:yes gene_type:complete
MKKLIYFIVFLIFLNGSFALTEIQKVSLEETLDLAGNNIEDYESVLNLLNDKEIDLSDEILLSNRVIIESENFGINPYEYENIKFAQVPDFHNFDEYSRNSELFDEEISESFNLPRFNYNLLGILVAVVLILFVIKNKNKFKRKPISNTEQQLKNFIKKAKNSGQSKEEIKQRLLQSGWPKKLIDKYL